MNQDELGLAVIDSIGDGLRDNKFQFTNKARRQNQTGRMDRESDMARPLPLQVVNLAMKIGTQFSCLSAWQNHWSGIHELAKSTLFIGQQVSHLPKRGTRRALYLFENSLQAQPRGCEALQNAVVQLSPQRDALAQCGRIRALTSHRVLLEFIGDIGGNNL